jgi:hypothetical protein
MTSLDRQKIAQDWVKLYLPSTAKKERSDYFWAFEKLSDLVRKEPEAAWTIIEVIRKLDSSDLILANLAAGPVEAILARHGEKFIERIEVLARQDPVFRKLLGAVWQNKISDHVWRRLKAVAGPSF